MITQIKMSVNLTKSTPNTHIGSKQASDLKSMVKSIKTSLNNLKSSQTKMAQTYI